MILPRLDHVPLSRVISERGTVAGQIAGTNDGSCIQAVSAIEIP